MVSRDNFRAEQKAGKFSSSSLARKRINSSQGQVSLNCCRFPLIESIWPISIMSFPAWGSEETMIRLMVHFYWQTNLHR